MTFFGFFVLRIFDVDSPQHASTTDDEDVCRRKPQTCAIAGNSKEQLSLRGPARVAKYAFLGLEESTEAC